MGKLKFLFTHFEDDYRRNARLVHRAAEANGVSEYELFQLAYRAWYGSEPEEQRLEKIFVAYLFTGRMPAWVRDLAQRSATGDERSRGAMRRCIEQLLSRQERSSPPQASDARRPHRLKA